MDQDENVKIGSGLALPMTVKELIGIRTQILSAWADANTAIEAVAVAFARIRDKDFHFHNPNSGHNFEPRQEIIDIKEMTGFLDYSLWEFTLEKLNITNAMTEMARDAYLQSLKEKKTPFTEIHLIGLAQNADKIFKDSSVNTIRAVFTKLIGIGYAAPASSKLSKKKDNLQKVEKIFRVGWSDVGLSGFQGHISSVGWEYRSQTSSHFRFGDLLTACRLIEGDGMPDYSNNLDSILRAAPKGDTADTGYFTLKAYKNRNVKVNWNEDKIHILEKLNTIGSGRENAMPDTQRKRYKAEHFHDGGELNPFVVFAPDPNAKPSMKKDFSFYPTPNSVARRMAELAEYPGEDFAWIEDVTTLEPSAGRGDLLGVIPWDAGCVAVEFNHHRCEALRECKGKWEIVEADFLKWETAMRFDRVLMNPPFDARIEAQHTLKAFSLLRPGGILVGIVPEGWFTREDTKAQVFRGFLAKFERAPSEKLPAGTFGRTRIETRIVILRKPQKME